MAAVYSHSRLSSFENCKKQFQFRYVLKIPQETEGIEAFVGKRVHEVLERLYQFTDQGMVPSLEKVLSRYQALWDEHYDAERVRIVRSGTHTAYYREVGERCLTNYYRRRYPFDEEETLGLEANVQFQLDPAGRYRMRGIVDRIARARDGAIEIHDYKTGRRVPSQQNLDEDRQLALYQLALAPQYGDEQPFRLVWYYVASGQIRSSARTPDQLDALRRDTIALIDRIGAEQEFPATKIALCDWCEYKPMCPAWAAAGAGNDAEPSGAPEPGNGAAPSAAPTAPEPPAPDPGLEIQLQLL